jgi:hypothetical protein
MSSIGGWPRNFFLLLSARPPGPGTERAIIVPALRGGRGWVQGSVQSAVKISSPPPLQPPGRVGPTPYTAVPSRPLDHWLLE